MNFRKILSDNREIIGTSVALSVRGTIISMLITTLVSAIWLIGKVVFKKNKCE